MGAVVEQARLRQREVAPQMAATGTPAARNSLALSIASDCSAQVSPPGRMSAAASAGVEVGEGQVRA